MVHKQYQPIYMMAHFQHAFFTIRHISLPAKLGYNGWVFCYPDDVLTKILRGCLEVSHYFNINKTNHFYIIKSAFALSLDMVKNSE